MPCHYRLFHGIIMRTFWLYLDVLDLRWKGKDPPVQQIIAQSDWPSFAQKSIRSRNTSYPIPEWKKWTPVWLNTGTMNCMRGGGIPTYQTWKQSSSKQFAEGDGTITKPIPNKTSYIHWICQHGRQRTSRNQGMRILTERLLQCLRRPRHKR